MFFYCKKRGFYDGTKNDILSKMRKKSSRMGWTFQYEYFCELQKMQKKSCLPCRYWNYRVEKNSTKDNIEWNDVLLVRCFNV